MTSAVILAGGLGTRLRSVVPDLPKPMAPINGEPFLAYQMRYWIGQGIDHVVLSVGHRYAQIIDYFGYQFEGAILEYVIEKSPMGTGGGLIMASKQVNQQENFLLLNGDSYFEIELNDFLNFSRINNTDWCFSLFKAGKADRYHVVDILSNGKISSIKSKPGCVDSLANGGVYLVNPVALSAIPIQDGKKASLEEDIFPAALKLGQIIYGKEYKNFFIDIGVPEDYHLASTKLIN